MQTVINNTLITYSDEGSGDVLLCLHGWMHDHTTFKNLATELSDTYRVMCVDLPNFGSSQITDKIVSISDYAEFVNLFAIKIGLNKYTILGHSMGCQIAIYAIGEGIVGPEKLILLSPAGVRNHKLGYKKSLRQVSRVLRHVVPKSYKKKLYKAIGSDYTPDLSEVHKRIIANTLSTDVQEQAKKISIPTIIINGSADKATPVWMAQIMHEQIVNSELHVIDNEGHLMHQHAAETVAKYIREFL